MILALVEAIETQFQGVMWQRCQTHFTRNILDACPKQLQSQLHSQLRVIWEAPDVETARQMLQRVMDNFGNRALELWTFWSKDSTTRWLS